MYSGEGEEVKLFTAIQPSENVEDWLLEVEKSMKASVRDNIEKSIAVYPEVRALSQTGRSLMCWFQACHRGHQRWGWWTWDVFYQNILFYSTFKAQPLIHLCACKCRMGSWARMVQQNANPAHSLTAFLQHRAALDESTSLHLSRLLPLCQDLLLQLSCLTQCAGGW